MEEKVRHGFPLPQTSVLEDKKVRPNPKLESGQGVHLKVGGATSYIIQGKIDDVLEFLDANKQATFESTDVQSTLKASVSEVTQMKLDSPEQIALQHVTSVLEKMMDSLSAPGQEFVETVLLEAIDSNKLNAIHEIKGVIDEIKEALQNQVAKIPELKEVFETVDKAHREAIQKVRDKRTTTFKRNQKLANAIQNVPILNKLNGLFSNGKEDIQIEINPHLNPNEQIAGSTLMFDKTKVSTAQLADKIRTEIINIHAETTQQLIASEVQEQRHLVNESEANDALLEQNTWPQNQNFTTSSPAITTDVTATSTSLGTGSFDEVKGAQLDPPISIITGKIDEVKGVQLDVKKVDLSALGKTVVGKKKGSKEKETTPKKIRRGKRQKM